MNTFCHERSERGNDRTDKATESRLGMTGLCKDAKGRRERERGKRQAGQVRDIDKERERKRGGEGREK